MARRKPIINESFGSPWTDTGRRRPGGVLCPRLGGRPTTLQRRTVPGLDWADLRAMLRDRGIDLRIGYVSETATNAQGGVKELWRYTDQWTFLTRLDLEKLFGISRAQLGIVITERNGHNLSADAHLGNLQQVQEVYGRGQTWRWTEFYYNQK
jgi:carbohydrate-selective porin OprB